MGQKTLDLPESEKRGYWQAVLTLRTTSVETQPAKNHRNAKNAHPLKVTVSLAKEESLLPNVEPVSWLLSIAIGG